MGLFFAFARRSQATVLPIDPEEQRILDELRARREEARRQALQSTCSNQGVNQ